MKIKLITVIELIVFVTIVLPIFLIVGMAAMSEIVLKPKCPAFKGTNKLDKIDKIDCSKCHKKL